MATILTKRSNTAASVPLAAQLTNSTLGAELAVNTADRRLFTKDGSGNVVELGTNPSSLTVAGATTLSAGTANGVAYLNASKVLTSGTSLTFDGTSLLTTAANTVYSKVRASGTGLLIAGSLYQTTDTGTTDADGFFVGAIGNTSYLYNYENSPMVFAVNSAEAMRLTGAGLSLASTSDLTLNKGTANGVAYLDGSKVLTTGSALTFDGTNLGIGAPSPQAKVHALGSGSGAAEIRVQNTSSSTDSRSLFRTYSNASTFGGSLFMTGTSDSSYPTSALCLYNFDNLPLVFGVNNSEQMRLTSTGLGIGTSSPSQKLAVVGNISVGSTGNNGIQFHSGSPTGSNLEWWVANNQGASNELNFYYYSGGTFAGIAMSLTKAGNLGIGTSSPISKLQSVDGDITVTTSGSFSGFNSTRAFTPSGVGQQLGRLNFSAYSTGTTYVQGASIQAFSSAAWSSTSAPSYLSFQTTASGSTSLTERMHLDSSGNLGLGVTPSAWYIAKAIQVNERSALFAFSNDAHISYNSVFTSAGNYRYIANDLASDYQQTAGQHRWYTAPSGTAGNTISFTQAMTLDASGNLGLGTTTPTSFGAGSVMQTVAGSSGYGGYLGATSNVTVQMWANETDLSGHLGTRTNHPLLLTTNNTERARITSSGDLLVGTTSSADNSGVGIKSLNSATAPYLATVGSASSNSTVAYSLYSTGAGAFRFYVGYGGTVFATSTTISAISDQRLKENVQDLDVGLDAIMALKPRKFDWKEGKGKNIKGDRGWIAQEFEQVFPDMIDEWRDEAPEGEEPYKSVRADLIPVLVKAIQELKAEVDSLKARLASN